MTTIAPFGSWQSPITADLVVAGSVSLGGITVDSADVYWVEGRPAEGGRNVIVKYDGSQIQDITPAPLNVRTRVHEYGGGSFTVDGGVIYFANFVDQRLYRQMPNSDPAPLTPDGKWRYADLIVDQQRHRLICVREDHGVPGEAENTLITIDLTTGESQVLASGHNFYASPRLSPDGTQLTWITWDHPNMPWEHTQLWVATLDNTGNLTTPQLIAGTEPESIFQPEWSPDGILYFISDRSNWWNLYRWHPVHTQGNIESVITMAAEFGLPQWVFGMSTYSFVNRDQLICTYTQEGNWYLARIDLPTRTLTPMTTAYTSITGVKTSGTHLYFLGGSPTTATEIVQWDLSRDQCQGLRSSSTLTVDTAYLSVPQSIEFPTENGKTAYGFFYPPTNGDYQAPPEENPPLVVKSHGGPTTATSSTFNLKIQYWTSRGFAVIDVNYGGSTGYGREYRQRLNYNWGIVDVDDCTNAAQYLAKQGWVDGNRMAIAGGSAGGYTTLCALTFRDVFKAGASYYGISDLEALATDTHKFESRYLDHIVGAYPEQKEIYQSRSPIHFTDQLSCPIIFFQGLQDKVVPPNQAEKMVAALKAKNLPVAYITFPEEQHGFRRAENIKATLDTEFYFYSRIFDFEPAEALSPLGDWNV